MGDVQTVYAASSSLHSNVEPASVALNANAAPADVDALASAGPPVIDVFGAVVSGTLIVHVRVAAVASVLLAVSVARTEKVCDPLASAV